MSQWGTERWFKRGETKIHVTAHVATSAWQSIGRGSITDDLLLGSIHGDREVAGQMLEQLKKCYVGKPYSLWSEPMTTEM